MHATLATAIVAPIQFLQATPGINKRCHQCFLFSWNIGWFTPKNIYFHYLKKSFPDQSIQKMLYLILKKEALDATTKASVYRAWSAIVLLFLFRGVFLRIYNWKGWNIVDVCKIDLVNTCVWDFTSVCQSMRAHKLCSSSVNKKTKSSKLFTGISHKTVSVTSLKMSSLEYSCTSHCEVQEYS